MAEAGRDPENLLVLTTSRSVRERPRVAVSFTPWELADEDDIVCEPVRRAKISRRIASAEP